MLTNPTGVARRSPHRRDARVLLLAFSASLLCCCWGLTWLQLDASYQEALDSGRRQAASLARVFGDRADSTIDAADQVATSLRRRYLQAGAGLDLAEQQAAAPAPLQSVSIADASGAVVRASQPSAAASLAGREPFRVQQRAALDAPYVSPPMPGQAAHQWSLQLTRRIDGPGGRFDGVVMVSLDPSYFTRLYDDVDLGRHGAIALIGADGVVRARRAGGRDSFGQQGGATPLFTLPQRRPSGSVVLRSEPDGVVRLGEFVKLKHWPMYIVVGLARDDVLAPYVASRRRWLALAATATLAVLLLTAALCQLASRLLVSRAHASAAHAARANFLGNMSHELRTPLNGILGFSDLLGQELTEAHQRAFAHTIHSSGTRLLQLIDAVLELSALDGGAVAVTLAPEPLPALLAQAVGPHLAPARAKQLALDWAVAPGTPQRIVCDRLKLVRLLDALLANAVAFTPSGAVRLDVSGGDGTLRFDVSDTGPGIAAAQAQRIFERFTQADDGPRRPHGGAGLGLAIARRLSELMGARLELRSAPGQGSRFSLLLPVR